MAERNLELSLRIRVLLERLEDLVRLDGDIDHLGGTSEEVRERIRRLLDRLTEIDPASEDARRRIDDLTDELERADHGSSQWEGTLGKLKGALGAIVAAIAVNEIAEYGVEALDAAAATGQWAEKIGLSVERLTALEDAARRNNVEIDGFRDGLQTLTERLQEVVVDGTGDAAESFRLLGVSATDVQGNLKTTDQVLLEIADRFQALDGEIGTTEATARKMFTALSIFGDEAGSQLIPVLNQGADAINRMAREAELAGRVITKDQVQAAQKSKEAISELSAEVNAFGRNLALNAAPALTDLVRKINEDVIPALKGFKDFLFGVNEDISQLSYEETLRGLVEASDDLADAQQRLAVAQKVLADRQAGNVFGATARGIAEAKTNLEAMNKEVQTAQARYDALTQRANELREAQAGVAGQAKDTADAIAKTAEAAAKSADATKDQSANIAELQRLYNEGRISIETYNEVLGKLLEKEAKLNSDSEEAIAIAGKLKDAFLTLGVDGVAEAVEQAKQFEKQYDRIKEQFKTGAIDIGKTQEAFLAYAEAALKAADATGGQVDPLLRAEAAALGVSNAYAQLEEQIFGLSDEFRALADQTERLLDAAERNTRAVGLETQAAIERARAAEQIARARGDEVAASEAAARAAALEAKQAREVTEAKKAAAAVAQARVAALQQEALADGELTAAEQEVIEAARLVAQEKAVEAEASAASAQAKRAEATAAKETAAATKEAATATGEATEATDQAADSASGWGDVIAGVVSSVYGLSKAAGDAFLGIQRDTGGASDAVAQLESQLLSTQETIRRNRESFLLFATGMTEGFDRWNESAFKIQEAFLRQRIEAQKLEESLRKALDTGTISSTQLEHAAIRARTQFDLLDQEQLQGLHAAIDQARQKMDALTESARRMREESERALAQERVAGDALAQEQLRLAEKRKALEDELAQAREAGNRQAAADLEAALRAEEQAHQIRMKRLQDEQRQRQQSQAGQSAGPAPSGSGPAGGGISLPTKTIKLELAGPNGARAAALVDDEEMAERFLRVLEQSGLRAGGSI